MVDYAAYKYASQLNLKIRSGSLSREDAVKIYKGLPDDEKQRFREIRPELFNTPSEARKAPEKGKRKGYGRFEVLNNFVDDWADKFSPAERAVWLHIFRHTHGKTDKCETTVRQIAQKANLSKTTVAKAMLRLEKKGLLIYVWRSVLNSGRPSVVRLTTVPLSDHHCTTE